jgi:NADH-quinone oxidoreductase subunit H
VLIPASLVWIVLVATIRALSSGEAALTRRELFIGIAVVFGVFFLLSLLPFGRRPIPADEDTTAAERGAGAAAEAAAGARPFDPMAGGYPVPPLPEQRPATLTGDDSREAPRA